MGALHRFILNINDKKVIDHINGNSLDNRKENLRVCTQQQNLFNKTLSKKSKSGFKGVWFRKECKTKPWQAQIKFNSTEIHLGYFKNKVEAALAYNQATLKYFGSFANINKFTY